MATALETASLVMVPSGYEDGTLGSLQPLDGTGDFTFTRGSNISATRVNEGGYIEKGHENLLLQSNTFSDAAWTKYNLTATGSQEGYDSTNDAWLISLTGGSGQLRNPVSTNGVQTFSVYAKADTLPFVALYFVGSGEGQYFDLENGTLGSVFISDTIDSSIESVGNGWYKCSITTNDNISQLRIYPAGVNNIEATSGSIYIQDAMLNQGLAAYPYLETTTTTAKGGILENMPRLDYSGGRCSLLLEPSRTNLITNSEYIVASTFPFTEGLTINNNYESSPEGVINAAKIIPTAVNSRHNLRTHLATPNNFDIISCFVKANGYDYVQLASWATGANYINFNLTNGTIGSIGSSGPSIYGIKDYGNGWYRIHANVQASGSGLIGIGIVTSASAAWAEPFTGNGTDGILIYGVQLEQDAPYPTSYIPTYGVSQTRLKDVFDTNADLSTYFGNGQGTFYFEFADQPFKYLTNNETINIGLRDGDYQFGLLGRDTSQFFSFINFPTTNKLINNVTGGIAVARKYLLKWNGSEFRCYVNGEFQFEFLYSVDFQPNNFGRYGTGYSNTYGELFSEMLFFPTALSDEACIELTTI